MGKYVSEWQNCASMGTCNNIVAELLVDATYHVVAAFDTVTVQNVAIANTTTNTITIQDAGIYNIALNVLANGGSKTFVYAVFVNGEETVVAPSDKAEGRAVASCLHALPAGAILDVRQKTTDGGLTLTIESIAFTVHRVI